jgi:hypothetical protein
VTDYAPPRLRNARIQARVNGIRILTPSALGSTTCRTTPVESGGLEMGRPGRKRRLVLEDEYWKLIGAGVGAWMPVVVWVSGERGATTGGHIAAGCPARCCPSTPGRAGSCRCWSGNGSPLREHGAESATSPNGSGARRRLISREVRRNMVDNDNLLTELSAGSGALSRQGARGRWWCLSPDSRWRPARSRRGGGQQPDTSGDPPKPIPPIHSTAARGDVADGARSLPNAHRHVAAVKAIAAGADGGS